MLLVLFVRRRCVQTLTAVWLLLLLPVRVLLHGGIDQHVNVEIVHVGWRINVGKGFVCCTLLLLCCWQLLLLLNTVAVGADGGGGHGHEVGL